MIQIKLEDFIQGDISIECNSQGQIDKISDWARYEQLPFNPFQRHVSYEKLIGISMDRVSSKKYKYRFSEVELIPCSHTPIRRDVFLRGDIGISYETDRQKKLILEWCGLPMRERNLVECTVFPENVAVVFQRRIITHPPSATPPMAVYHISTVDLILTKRDNIRAKIKKAQDQISELKKHIQHLQVEDWETSDDKQWYTESDEPYYDRTGKKNKLIGNRRIGRINWKETFTDESNGTPHEISRSKVVRINGEWLI